MGAISTHVGGPVENGHTCVIVWNSAPARLCSCGRLIFATNSVPAAKTKSAPNTDRIAEGNPNAQYGAESLMTANRRFATAVRLLPATMKRCQVTCRRHGERAVPMRNTTSTRPTKSATMRLHIRPVTNIGSNRTIVRTGVRCRKFW